MQSRLQKKLLSLLPLYDKSVEEENSRLFRAADILAEVEGDLSPNEMDTVRRFLARIVYDFIKDIDIRRAFRSSSEGFTTSIPEMGKKIEITELKPKDFENSVGFGPSFHKMSANPAIRPHLEYILQMLWEGNHREFTKMATNLDKHYGKTRWHLKRIVLFVVLFPIFIIYLAKRYIKPFSSEQLAISLRIFLYASVSGEIWHTAVRWLLNSPWSVRPDLQHIYTIAGFKLVNGKNLGYVEDTVRHLPREQQFLLLGALGQQDNKTVDELVSILRTASPPMGMRSTNALILAAQQNPYAVKRFIDVITNRDMFPEAVEEMLLIQKYLVPVSLNALTTMLEEAYSVSKQDHDLHQRSRQSAARYLLKNAAGFEPSATGYLLHTIETSNNIREVIIAIDTLRNKLSQISDTNDQPLTSRKLVSGACALIRNRNALFEKIEDIDFEFLDVREAAVKLAIQAIAFSPLDVHQVLLIDIIDSLLSYDDIKIDSLQESGVSSRTTKHLMREFLFSKSDGNEITMEKVEELLALRFFQIIQKTPDGIPTLIVQDLQKSDPAWHKLHSLAYYLTHLIQSQIVATRVLSQELSGYSTNTEWLQKQSSSSLNFLINAPPTLNNFILANHYLLDLRAELQQEVNHRIKRYHKIHHKT